MFGTKLPVMTVMFNYEGAVRLVDNVELEKDYDTLIGMEISKNGMATHRVKRYKLGKVFDLERVPPVPRTDLPVEAGS